MNTLTKNFVKRGLSLFLTVLLVFSLFTVGITSAFAADVDVAPTGADTITVYFQNNWKWTDVKIHYWGGTTSSDWNSRPKMTLHENDGTYDIYKYDIPANSTGMLFTGIKNDDSGATDQSPDITNIQTGVCYYMWYENGNQVKTFDYKTVTLTTATATVAEGPFTKGDDIEITVQYDYSGNTNTVPAVKLYNSDGTAVDTSIYRIGKHTTTECVITLSTSTLSADTYKIYAVVSDADNDLRAETEKFSIIVRNPLTATLTVVPEEDYVNNNFVFTVTDNAVSDSYGTPTYALYKEDGTLVESTWNGNTTTVVLDTTGEQKYYATVTVDGLDPVQTAPVSVNVTEFTDFSFTATYPTSVQATETIKINASLTGSVPYPVTYVLTNAENSADIIYSTAENGGVFSISTDTTDIGTTKSYILTAYATVDSKEVYSTTSININVDVTEITETKNVTIYFKSTDTFGYAPYANIVGVKESKTGNPGVPMEKAAYITGNANGAAHYWWYKISIEVASTKPSLSFNVISDRYNMEHTIEFEAVNSEYWFAVDNLNTKQTTDKEGNIYNYSLIDVSDWSEAKRNWTQSAAHMLWDDDVDGPWVENSINSDKDTAEAASYKAVSLGDANGDGVVNIKDATYIQKVIAELETADSVSRVVSDVDGDRTVTIKDATAIQMKLVASL